MTAEPNRRLERKAQAVYSPDGRLLRASAPALELLEEQPSLREELARLVRARRRAVPGDAPVDVAGRGRRYMVRCTVIEAELIGEQVSVLVTIESLADRRTDLARLCGQFDLTPRQAEVALLLAARRSNREIAEHLCVSPHTARHHVQSVLTKLNVKSRSDARRMIEKAQH